jgi:hypothetical protein
MDGWRGRVNWQPGSVNPAEGIVLVRMSSGSPKKSIDDYIKRLSMVAESDGDSEILKRIVAMLAAKPKPKRRKK